MEAALSLRSLFCQPCATDQQSASQPCTDLIPLPLTISVSSYLALPLRQRPLPSPCLLPTPTACLLPVVHVCLATFLTACLLLLLPVSLLFLQLSCLCARVSVCPSACLPASRFFSPISLHRKAARLSAALPICLSICHLFASLFVCLHVYVPVYLSVSPSVY